MSKTVRFWVVILAALMAVPLIVSAAPRKTHSVVLGAVKKVTYTKAGDPAGAAATEDVYKRQSPTRPDSARVAEA